MPQQERILVVKLASLGDIITASTLLTRIRQERPDAHVTWLVGRTGASLVRLFPGIDEILEVDDGALLQGTPTARLGAVARSWAQLLGRRFDRVLIPHLDPRYRLLIPAATGKVRMFDQSVPGLKNPIPGRFNGDEAARLLDPPGHSGYRTIPYEIVDLREAAGRVQLPPVAVDRLKAGRIDVVLFPGGARNLLRDDHLRRWPLGHYVDVARALTLAGRRVAIAGSESDAWVRDAFAGIGVVDLVGILDVPQTLRMLIDARLVVSHDTGPLHFARAVRARIVALFGPTTPRQVIGEPESVTVLWGGANLPCRPCYDGREFPACARNHCLEEVTVGSVVSAAQAYLE
jgi:heptosyltransferase-2